jgi:molybdopterin-guanine dinucleotide biosynthesis protein A
MDERALAKSPYSIKIDKKRLCLKCDLPFLSSSSWNRLCTKCNNDNDNIKKEIPFHGWKLMSSDLLTNIKHYSHPKGKKFGPSDKET